MLGDVALAAVVVGGSLLTGSAVVKIVGLAAAAMICVLGPVSFADRKRQRRLGPGHLYASPIDISESDVRVLAGDAFDPATVRIERGLVASLVTITTIGLEWEATWLKERDHRPHVHVPWTDVADISVRKTAGLMSPALFELSLQTGQSISFVGRHYRDAENALAAIKPTLA